VERSAGLSTQGTVPILNRQRQRIIEGKSRHSRCEAWESDRSQVSGFITGGISYTHYEDSWSNSRQKEAFVMSQFHWAVWTCPSMQMTANKCVCVCVCVCTGRPQGRDYLERAKCFVRYDFVRFVCYCWLTIAFTLTMTCGRPRRRWQARTQAHPYLVAVVLLLFPCACSLLHVLSVLSIEWANKVRRLCLMYSVIQKEGLNFVRLYFLNYTWYVNELHNIWKRRS